MPTKLFRTHRGGLVESLETTIKVDGITDLLRHIAKEMPWAKNVKIRGEAIKDTRLPSEWNNLSYYVVADFEGYTEQCIGMTNFFESI